MLPLGFLLTHVHDHRLRRLRTHIRGDPRCGRVGGEEHCGDRSSTRRSIGWIVLLAITFAIQRPWSRNLQSGLPGADDLVDRSGVRRGQGRGLISTVGQLFCGIACLTSASRMSFAFSRDRAVPGHNLWRKLGQNRTPTWAVFFVVLFALIITVPAYFPNSKGSPVAFLAVTSISVIGLYIAYTIPVFLRWRQGEKFVRGSWTLGSKYKWINPMSAFVWVGICVVIFSLPFSPEGVPWESAFNWSAVNYAPLITIAVMLGVTIWYAVSAKNTFKGPVRTIDELDTEIALPAVAESP